MMRMNIMTAVIAVVIVAVRAHVVPEDFVVLQEVSVQQGQLVSESPVLRSHRSNRKYRSNGPSGYRTNRPDRGNGKYRKHRTNRP